MNEPTGQLIQAVRVYLRQDARLRRVGLGPLTEQPGWALEALWAYAGMAGERLERWQRREIPVAPRS